MESRFSHLRQRDNSVSMLRVKMSRRRSRSQKENRERAVNTRRQLEKLAEMDISSVDASIAVANMSTIQEKTQNNAKSAKTAAQQERIKQLERWKERKALEREKEKREERKGVFKTGLYRPKDSCFPVSQSVPPPSTRPKEKKVNTTVSQSTRVTRSMKQQQQQQQEVKKDLNNGTNKGMPAMERSTRATGTSVKLAPSAKTKVSQTAGPAVQPLATRSANRLTATKTPLEKEQRKEKPADVRTTRARTVNPTVPPSGQGRNCKAPASNTENLVVSKELEPDGTRVQEPEKASCPPKEEDMCVDQDPKGPAADVDTGSPSFAPEGFVFEAPVGLSSFKFHPLTPRSADAFLTPSFNFPPAAVLTVKPQDEPREPSPQQPPTPSSPLESKHDVPYFRLEIVRETDRLMSLCLQWESKVDDHSIPEEMRDQMRTAIGQARLLMKERFNQFSGLVDDCELGRGEKVTTCTDLQGFWDMVYYQVEDVNKKFDALKEAEGRGWVEDHKPPPRQRKLVKKPAAAPVKVPGTKAAAKSRLAAVKAALKAKQQAAEAENAAGDTAANTADVSSQDPQPQTGAQTLAAAVLDGGLFKVESPVKPPVRRSSRLSAALLPQASPHSTYLSPRRVACASPAQPSHTPVKLCLTFEQTPAPKSQAGTPRSSQNRKEDVNVSPIKEVPSEETKSPTAHEDAASAPQLATAALPSISLGNVYGRPAEAIDDELPLSLSSEPSSCITPSPVPTETQEFMCHTPNSSDLQELPGLDFERYLQPSHRGSLSPMETDSEPNVEMESPRGQPGEVLTPGEPALSEVSSRPLQSPQVQTAESDMLLFTQDLKDRIRESVCPSDLMVFTPPSNK